MSTAASSQIDLPAPAFKIYRRYNYKCEGDLGDDDLNRTIYWGNDHEPEAPPPPPFLVVVQGPPNVGKSLLIKSLVKYFAPAEGTTNVTQGPITTILTGDKRRRLQFVECPDDIDAMIDAAKYADLVLLLVDANYGFEAETFEFLNLLRAHGLPKVAGVLTHVDEIEDEQEQNKTKERVEDHFRTEIYQPAYVYNLSGLQHDLYNMQDIQVLAEHILMLQLHLSSRRAAHPYMLVERFEDVTPPRKVRKDANCNRNISLYGYLRGCDIKSGAKVHIAGLDDFHLAGVRSTTDPFPLSPEMEKENDFVGLTLMENKSFRTGTYLRLEVHDISFGMVANLYSCHPILVGGISPEEKDVGYMQARLKRHNWHMKLLKSADPVTMSAGWRRYWTKPIYGRQIDNARHQIRDFIPEHEHCLAMFWGPVAPPNTRITIVHRTKEVFRVAAKAVLLDPKHHMKIMEEVEHEGEPHKIFDERIALIKFKPEDIDVAAFIGASIRTESGIWGKVNKEEKRKGIVSCEFEKKIYKSDIFIMPVLCEAVAPRLFKQCDSIAALNKYSLKEKDPAQRPLRRRRVEITDEEPHSYPYSTYFTLILNIKYLCNKQKETVVVMSEEKRKELVKNQQREKESKKLSRFYASVKDMWI
ncbi:hypothetical protein MKW92_027508 [Papaver armeniacum]|nr:hypothetical protein MKW92_027508 [Papaver armeniacum]